MEADNAKKVAMADKAGKSAYFAAVEYLACVEILRAANTKEVVEGIENRKGDKAFDIIKKAMFTRVLLGSMVTFDPVRDKGDYHLRVGMDILKKGEVTPKDEVKAILAQKLFAELQADASFEKLRQHRNKEAAHLSEADAAIDQALIGELLTFAEKSAEIASVFIEACGIQMPSISSQVAVYKESAVALFAAFAAAKP